MLDVDLLLEKCGNFHRFQILMLILFCIVNILSSMHYFSQTIISFVPDHWCSTPDTSGLTVSEIRTLYNNREILPCTNITAWTVTGKEESDQCSSWTYATDFGYQSMTMETNWVCDSAWKSALGQSMFFIGSVIGSLTFGILADVIGRLPVLILANMMAFLGNFLTIFTTTVTSFSIARFTSGLATDSNFVMMYILVLEYLKPSMRTFGLNLCIGVFYCLGSVITPWIAVALGHWKSYLLATVIPILIIPLFYLVLPESIQWLITKRKPEKALKIFKQIAKFNRIVLDKGFENEFMIFYSNFIGSNSKKSANILDLFKTPRLRKNTLILFFKSMVITLCYDAISKNVEGLGVSSFTMFSLSSTAILPACLVILLLQDKIGRKAMASSSLLVSGIFTSVTGFLLTINKDINPVLAVLLSMIARFGITTAYNSSAQYATEIIPTCVRAQGVAAVHVTGYAFTFFSSFILYLSHFYPYIPSLILGFLTILGALLCLLLPETLNRTIPATLEDAEKFGKDEPLLYFSCLDKKENKSNKASYESQETITENL